MKPINSLLILISMYLIAQTISLFVGSNLIPRITTGPEIKPGQIPSAVPEPEAPESSGQIFFYILIMTGIMLFFIKFKLSLIIKILMFLALFVGMNITFWAFFGDFFSILLSIIIFLLYLWKRENIILMNCILILTIAGISGYLGASLGILPSLLLLLLLSAYDIIAVFFTKHMVTLAKESKGNIPMFSIPIKERFLGMGTGDLAIPAVFTVSVLRDYSMNLPLVIITVIGGLLGLISLFFYILKKEKVTLPALPPIAIGLVIGFLIGFLVLRI